MRLKIEEAKKSSKGIKYYIGELGAYDANLTFIKIGPDAYKVKLYRSRPGEAKGASFYATSFNDLTKKLKKRGYLSRLPEGWEDEVKNSEIITESKKLREGITIYRKNAEGDNIWNGPNEWNTGNTGGKFFIKMFKDLGFKSYDDILAHYDEFYDYIKECALHDKNPDAKDIWKVIKNQSADNIALF